MGVDARCESTGGDGDDPEQAGRHLEVIFGDQCSLYNTEGLLAPELEI